MPDFTGWILDRNGAAPFQVHAEPDALGAIQLGTGWPLQGLQSNTVSVIGTGSIGSAATRALADVGIGTINLIDPDRLLWHNIVRHQLGPSAIGRYKVDALADALRDRSRPNAATGSTSYRTHRVDAVEQAADLFPLIHRAQVVLCAADGIAPRRVVNHLARLAGTPAIFACVLDDGSVGEIFRSRPGTKFGCLLCHRAWLAEQGWMDPEADQELAYGTGTSHKPMTAVPSDLQLIGQLAAQITLATLLESRHGRPGASLPNEHAVIGLRPTADLGGPFNVAHAGEVRWASVPPPRTDCPTCSLAN
ncbi:HesA/MoeB/ThiF family protein [Curtobacterium sp. VKM Ac-2865]|uniref:HesA/MoeB/ThiF family protein n=1 Tax=Curtobacterium sp. VKM Ac-2865 TaxID=2783817 RepID=UPI003A5C487B